MIQQLRIIQALGFPMVDAGAHVEHVGAADHFIHAAEAELGHQLANLLGHEEEVVDDVLRLAR